MRPLNTATEPCTDVARYRPRRLIRDETGRWLGAARVMGGFELIWNSIWFVVSLPFRLVFGLFSLLGRLAGLIVGFSIMVLGAALLPGPLVLIGLPLFAFGLILALRSLG